MQSSIQIIEAGLNRVSAIVKDVKEFVSPNLNTRINVSLREIIESTLSLLSYQIDGKITLHRNYETAGAIKGVQEQLHQVFTNLIKNAIEAMNGVGHLWIRISQEGNETIISIRDDGPVFRTITCRTSLSPSIQPSAKKAEQDWGLQSVRKSLKRTTVGLW
jgi:C4-dicarboxylate-specific signal transduction histidine kinase